MCSKTIYQLTYLSHYWTDKSIINIFPVFFFCNNTLFIYLYGSYMTQFGQILRLWNIFSNIVYISNLIYIEMFGYYYSFKLRCLFGINMTRYCDYLKIAPPPHTHSFVEVTSSQRRIKTARELSDAKSYFWMWRQKKIKAKIVN